MPRGSKPGERRGGRRVGSKNRRTLELESAARQTVKDAESPSSGQMPKEFLLAVSQNEKLPLAVRVDAAKAVVAFYSPRLANAHLDADVRGQYWISDKPMTREEWEAEFCTETPDGVQKPLLVRKSWRSNCARNGSPNWRRRSPSFGRR